MCKNYVNNYKHLEIIQSQIFEISPYEHNFHLFVLFQEKCAKNFKIVKFIIHSFKKDTIFFKMIYNMTILCLQLFL